MLKNERNGAKNTAEKVEVKRFQDAPARLTTGPAVLLNDSQGFARAATRVAVLLLGGWGEERAEGSPISSGSCCKMGEMVRKKNTA